MARIVLAVCRQLMIFSHRHNWNGGNREKSGSGELGMFSHLVMNPSRMQLGSHLNTTCPNLILTSQVDRCRTAQPTMPHTGDTIVSRNATLDTRCNAWHYTGVDIESISHKALRKFVETGKSKGVIEPRRIQLMIALILNAESIEELNFPPNFGFHALSGDRDGSYSMTVTRNWRLTFSVVNDDKIADLDLEDYH